MIIPGLVSVTFRSRTPEWIVERCRIAGLKAIEWSEQAHVLPGDEAGAKALYELTRNAGLAVAAYGSYYRLGEQDSPAEVFAGSLQSAAALQAPIIRIWAGTRPSAEVEDEELYAMAREAAMVSDLAEKAGIRVALEWHRNTLTDTNESAMKLLKLADHPNLYCLWQPTVALDMDDRIKGLSMLGDRLLNLHIYYWPEGVKRPLEEGIEQWQQYLSVISRDTDRYGLMEFVMDESEEQFFADAEILRQLLAH